MSHKVNIFNSKGQGSVEYILMLLVVSVIVYSVMGKVQNYFGDATTNCTQNSTEFICKVSAAFSPSGAYPFKYYTLQGVR